ncbi:MAG: alanine--tRNA ligase [Firmicutes bacterium GWF2_51_9]|nr:MAG: alanine--tRNA ligase [Firmicutes bacterium GWF2_51_9]OGS57751.1 MAG: alanine--tRNA ligase [Firmicutes bacterium GWE2_51_13]HBZ40601.1 alanine--tRNA ligase [Erysipelotrichaceae bacterium]
MKYRNSWEIRQLFLDYFASKGHMVEPGASLVPINDPTLLWINSGVAALKKYFDGSVQPSSNRIVNAQKSIRTNDIENVGKTARHHTFFEMLGNFSIGDYFKEDAIQYAWEFLTSEDYIGFDKDRMYVTVHPLDTEAYRIWTEIVKLEPKRILKSEENYWQIGEGPCGPNTEIYYDRGESFDPNHEGEELFFNEKENDRYIEVWNVVFSQYDGKEGVERSEYKELPQRNIDTGMGFERLVCIVQGGETNYDTDLFLPVIRVCETLAKHPYQGEYKMAYRVIADHIRTVTFALADGALFSNEGRGYVLRRILRRAVRYGIKLGIREAFMYRLVQIVAENMKSFYPYLLEKIPLIERLVKSEEQRFHQTLNGGENLLMNLIEQASSKELDGESVFKLYDTFGFPVELTKEIAEEKGYAIDMTGFKRCMQEQRERARNAREEVESMASQSKDLMEFTHPSEFVGYETFSASARVIGLFVKGVQVDTLDGSGEAIFDITPFYAESGGQVADIGTLTFEGGSGSINDVRKAPHKQALHAITLNEGILNVGDVVELKIDVKRRKAITANHSSAHLLQSALKKVVGTHIQQAGSFVGPDYMRFDFTHFEKVSEAQLIEIETLVNSFIFSCSPVDIKYMDIEEAKQNGATALFDEKYDKVVRVVTMGEISKELCGGCHVFNTQEVGVFKIDSEESIGSGIRRITAKTGMAAYHDFVGYKNQLKTIADLYKAGSTQEIEDRVKLSVEENSDLRKELGLSNQKLAVLEAEDQLKNIVVMNGMDVLIIQSDGDGDRLKTMAEHLKKKVSEGLVVVAGVCDEKAMFVVASGKKAQERGFKAGDVAKQLALHTQGNGGGRPDFAQSGGKDVAKLPEALDILRSKLA